MITVYTMAYNEEIFLQYMIDHYRSKFPNCHIVLNDNESTDNTAKIGHDNGCEVRTFHTNNQIDDIQVTQLKNNCWRDAQTDWVIVCDVDELLNISEEELKKEETLGTTIIQSEGWNMVNMEDNYDFASIKHGTRVPQYDKSYLFNKKFISHINYTPGCHSANPHGVAKYSDNKYKLYHYKCIHPDHLVERYRLTSIRLSEGNRKRGMGTYWLNNSEANVRAGFENGRLAAKNNKVIP